MEAILNRIMHANTVPDKHTARFNISMSKFALLLCLGQCVNRYQLLINTVLLNQLKMSSGADLL